jgi:hypothetical protein
MSKGPVNPERSFGLSVGGVLLALAVLLVWRHHPLRAEVAGAVGAILVASALVHAPLLKYPSAAWWRFAKALGWVNARVLLTVLFAIVLTPLSIVWALIGKDPLGRRRERWNGWSAYPARYRDPRHYERMY